MNFTFCPLMKNIHKRNEKVTVQILIWIVVLIVIGYGIITMCVLRFEADSNDISTINQQGYDINSLLMEGFPHSRNSKQHTRAEDLAIEDAKALLEETILNRQPKKSLRGSAS